MEISNEIAWLDEADSVFVAWKALCKYPVLHSPLPQYSFLVCTDASNVSIVAMLAQQTPQREHPIFPLSWKLIPTEQHCTAIEKGHRELPLLSVVSTVQSGHEHALLQCLQWMKDANPHLI